MTNHKTLLRYLLTAALAAFGFVGLANAQATLGSTTLSAAVSGTLSSSVSPINVVALSSVSGFTANVTDLIVDKELMAVTSVNSATNTLTVVRGAFGTKAVSHNSGATVYYGPGSYFADTYKTGGCTASKEIVLPLFSASDGAGYDCRSSGQWIKIFDGTMRSGAVEGIRTFCTGTSGSGETEYLNGAACSGATTPTARYVVPQTGTLANLRVYSSAAVVGGSSKDVLTVLDNGSATALTCTIAASGTTCSDLTHSVAVAAGDVLTFKWVTATSDTAANVSVGLERF